MASDFLEVFILTQIPSESRPDFHHVPWQLDCTICSWPHLWLFHLIWGSKMVWGSKAWAWNQQECTMDAPCCWNRMPNRLSTAQRRFWALANVLLVSHPPRGKKEPSTKKQRPYIVLNRREHFRVCPIFPGCMPIFSGCVFLFFWGKASRRHKRNSRSLTSQ